MPNPMSPPIPIEVLRAVRRVVVHTNCPDGRAAALIIHTALPDVEVVEMAYGEPAHDMLVAEPGLLFCDFTPPRDRLAEFAAVGTVVLDHHDRTLVEPFGKRGVFGENAKGESGARLAFDNVCYPVWCFAASATSANALHAAHRLANLVAIRDTWQRSDRRWEEACELSEALRFVPLEDLLALGVDRFDTVAAELGPLLLRKKRKAARHAAENAVRYVIRHGLRVAMVARSMTEDVADLLGEAVDVVAGFDYVQEAEGGRVRLVVSLRSPGTVDVTRIARKMGGNGHDNGRTAGFSVGVTTDPFAHYAELTNPYERIHRILRDVSITPEAIPRQNTRKP